MRVADVLIIRCAIWRPSNISSITLTTLLLEDPLDGKVYGITQGVQITCFLVGIFLKDGLA